MHRRLVSTAGNVSALVTMFQSVTDVSATKHILVTCVKTGKVSIKILILKYMIVLTLHIQGDHDLAAVLYLAGF